MVSVVGQQFLSFRRSCWAHTRCGIGRNSLPAEVLQLSNLIVFGSLEHLLLQDPLEMRVSVLVNDVGRIRVRLRRMHRRQIGILESPFFAFTPLFHKLAMVLCGETAGFHVSFQPMSASGARQLPLDVLVQVVLLLLPNYRVEDDKEHSQARDEDSGGDELVPPPSRSPRDHVVREYPGAYQEYPQHQEADSEVEHSHGTGQAMVWRCCGLLLTDRPVRLLTVDAGCWGGQAPFPFDGPLFRLLSEASLAFDGEGRVQSGRSVHLQWYGVITKRILRLFTFSRTTLHTAQHCTHGHGAQLRYVVYGYAFLNGAESAWKHNLREIFLFDALPRLSDFTCWTTTALIKYQIFFHLYLILRNEQNYFRTLNSVENFVENNAHLTWLRCENLRLPVYGGFFVRWQLRF